MEMGEVGVHDSYNPRLWEGIGSQSLRDFSPHSYVAANLSGQLLQAWGKFGLLEFEKAPT